MTPDLGIDGGGSVIRADFVAWPVRMRLKVDADRVLRRVGTRTAAAVRKRIRSGMGANGQALPKPEGAKRSRKRRRKRDGRGKPLNRTGSLLKSIKYDRRRKAVRPMGNRGDLGHGLRSRQESLLWVLIHTSDDRTGGAKMDPMGVDRPLRKAIQDNMRRALAKELARPGYGIQAELRRHKPGRGNR